MSLSNTLKPCLDINNLLDVQAVQSVRIVQAVGIRKQQTLQDKPLKCVLNELNGLNFLNDLNEF